MTPAITTPKTPLRKNALTTSPATESTSGDLRTLQPIATRQHEHHDSDHQPHPVSLGVDQFDHAAGERQQCRGEHGAAGLAQLVEGRFGFELCRQQPRPEAPGGLIAPGGTTAGGALISAGSDFTAAIIAFHIVIL